jgi:hypothetical protein
MGACVFRHQVGMLTQPVTGALDLHDNSVVQEAVEKRGCDDGIAEYVAPFGKAPVGGQDHRRGNLTEGLYIGLDYEKVCFSQKKFS